EFEECAATSGDVGDFVSDTEQVDCCQGVTTACDRERFAVCDSVSNNFSPFTEVREFEHANRTVPQDSFCVFQDFSQFLCRNVAQVQNLLFIFDVVYRFQGSSRRFGELSGNANIGWNRDITGAQQAFGFVNQVCFIQGFTDVVALSGNEGVRDTTANDQLVSNFRQGIQNGQFGRNFRTTHDGNHWTSRFFQCFTQRIQFRGQQRTSARNVCEFTDTGGRRLRTVCSTECIHYEYVAQRRVFFGECFVVFLLAFVEANVFQHHQLTGSHFHAIQVIFHQANRAGQFVFQVINNRQQRELFVVLAFSWTTQVGGHHHFRTLLQSQFDGWQRCTDTRVTGHFAIFNWHVQIRTDENAFTSQIQIGHLNYRHGESSR